MRRAFRLLVLLLGCTPAMAQDTAESRLREMLRRTTADMRAAQDGQAALQAALDQEKQKSAILQKQLDNLAAHPPEAPKPTISDADLARVRAEADAKLAALQGGLKQWQDAYQKAAEIAREKDQESRTAAGRVSESEREAGICAAVNVKLEGVANDILHLYQTQSFRSLLLGSYEPLLGLKKVELENTIQDYEDKILDQKYHPGQVRAKTETPK